MSIQKLPHSWSFTSKTHTSSSKVSIVNRSMVLPWVPPISSLITSLFMEEFDVKGLSSAPYPPLIAKVCGWHFCHPGGKTYPTTTPTNQLTGPTHTIHCGGAKPRGSSTILGHLGFSRSQQHLHHLSLQKAHPHRPISTLGQQLLHHSKNMVFSTL